MKTNKDQIEALFGEWEGTEGFVTSREGHMRPPKALFLAKLLQKLKPQRVLEIGFNQGHSAFVVLSFISKKATLESIDWAKHPSVMPNSLRLQRRFPNFRVYWGDSQSVLPILTTISEPWDFIIVDGGHHLLPVSKDCEISLRSLTERGVLLMDDYRRKPISGEKVYVSEGVNSVGDRLRGILPNLYNSELGVLLLSHSSKVLEGLS